jgi:hypothetical protein
MNDPNGFSKTHTGYHLFYQHYPHSLKWNRWHNLRRPVISISGSTLLNLIDLQHALGPRVQ